MEVSFRYNRFPNAKPFKIILFALVNWRGLSPVNLLRIFFALVNWRGLSPVNLLLACKAGGFAGGMIRKQRLRTTGRHFERANKGETGERKKEKGRGWGRGKRREEGGVWGCEEPPAWKLGPSEFSVHGGTENSDWSLLKVVNQSVSIGSTL